MSKINLPVIILRGLVLLPNNEIRLEFDNQIDHSIIDMAELLHDNKIVIVSQPNMIEEKLNIKNMPRIAILGKIKSKIELPNGIVRINLKTTNRVNIIEYLNLNKSNEILESIVETITYEIDSEEETIYFKKITKELEEYVKIVPYISNDILTLIKNSKNLSSLTDVVVSNIPLDISRLEEYLMCLNPIERAKMLLEDIYKDKEVFFLERNIDLKLKREMDNNQRDFILREKIKLIKEELGENSIKEDESEQLKEKIDACDCNEKVKARLYNELRRFESTVPSSPEINVIHSYINWLLDLPWNIYTEDNHNLKLAKEQLDISHYGLDKIKERIIEFLAVKELANGLKGPIICLVGPPGVGKTTLASSIAAAMNRKFIKMSVGGVNDEAEIVGHRKTYLGASPGRIITSICKAKSANPVFLIDEIDKMTSDFKGDPASSLLSVLDKEQNKYFSDNYIEEEFDLSDVFFILTANYVEQIPAALKDRLEIIDLSGYTEFEKIDIAMKHVIPKICKEHGLKQSIKFPKETLIKIIRGYTKEAGVRELERQLSNVVRKVVTQIVMNNIKITNLTINENDTEKYLGKIKYHDLFSLKESQIGMVNGLAYTSYGGDTLPIEVNYYKGSGKLYLTGSLGDVMKESAEIALSYIKANHEYFKISYQELLENDIHIHVPEGAIPKDGPSAGVSLCLAIISAFSKLKISKDIALTGEITLHGQVLGIGGLKEKSIGALRNGITTIFIPKDNVNELDEIPTEVTSQIKYIPVSDFKKIITIIKKENANE